MGKNRKTVQNSYSKEFFDGLNKKIRDWVEFSFGYTPDDYLTDDELDFIFQQMENSETTLTRVEEAERNFEKEVEDEDGWYDLVEPKVGDTFNFNGKLKAFSKTEKATRDFMRRYMKDRKNLVIYRLPKGTQHFDVQKYDNFFDEEKESWVKSNGYVITGIEDVSKQFAHKRVQIVDLEPIK